jgi:hypothetical protein
MDADSELMGAISNSGNTGRSTDAARADDQFSAPRWSPSQPRDRNDFEIAIICALPLEASAVGALFDKLWDARHMVRRRGTQTLT